ncbi:MAG: hypothetical protein ABI045_02425 [Flavobacteriales bacterium]
MTINVVIFDYLWMITCEFLRFSGLWGQITQDLRTFIALPKIQDKVTAKALVVKKGEIVFDTARFQHKSSDGILFQG